MQSIFVFFERLKDYLNIHPAVMISVKVLAVIVISFLVIRLGTFIIKKILSKKSTFKYGLNSRKIDTIASLVISILRYAVYAIAIIVILSDVMQIKSILAAAGVGGIAIGLGLQGFIKDVVSGFFIVMEDQYAVGDIITIDSMNGSVEQLELRVTKIRNFNGDLYIIPNGEIKRVTNHTRGNKTVIVDVPLNYGTDVNKAIEAANKVCSQLTGRFESMVEPLQVLGITEMGKFSMNLRITAKTPPNEHWEVEREVRRLISEEFKRESISISSGDYRVLREDV